MDAQRRGFIRRTLKAGRCDLVMGVPGNYDMVLPTKPYYRSTYVFVYPASRKPQLRSFDDPVLRQLRIGLHVVGDDGDNPPPAHALARRGIVGNIVGFTMWDVDTVARTRRARSSMRWPTATSTWRSCGDRLAGLLRAAAEGRARGRAG